MRQVTVTEQDQARADDEGLLVVIHKGLGQELRIRRVTLSGREFIDLRLWIDNSLDPTVRKWIPTKKGLSLTPEFWEKVVAALVESLKANSSR